MATPSENISSYMNHIMSKLILSDNIVRAVADNHADFLSDRYEISDDEVPEAIFSLNLNNDTDIKTLDNQIIRDNKIYRNALKYTKITPTLYKDEVLEKQQTLIFFTVDYISNLGFAKPIVGNNPLLGGYLISFRVHTHDNIKITKYNKLRQIYICEQIEKLFLNSNIGRQDNKSFADLELKSNGGLSLYNGTFYGREMKFITTGFAVDCDE